MYFPELYSSYIVRYSLTGRYTFQEVQGILTVLGAPRTAIQHSSPREPRLGKQLQLQLRERLSCPWSLSSSLGD